MHFKTIIPAALAVSLASAQGGGGTSLTDLLGSTDSLSSLATLLEAYPSLAQSLAAATNVTLFAPNNAAIAELQQSGALGNATDAQVAALLSYHVVAGEIPSDDITEEPVFAATTLDAEAYTTVTGGQVVQAAVVDGDVIITSGLKAESTVVSADNEYDNGIVHIVDTVLTIPPSLAATALAANLTALLGAVTAAGIAETLDSAADLTIFAPSNAAFQAIGSGLGNLTTAQLTSILEYHVIEGTVVYSSDIEEGDVTTLSGDDVTISVEDGAVFVNAARVINADILIPQGVLHIIDSVLNPNDPDAEPEPNSNSPVAQFSGVSSASLAALTSGLPAASTTVSALVATTEDVAAAATGGGSASGGGGGGSGSGSSSGGGGGDENVAALPVAAVGAAALFGGAALLANW